VLFCTDFSEGSEAAFRVLTDLARKTQLSCELLHVQEEARMRYMQERVPEFDRKDLTRLEQMKAALVEAGAGSVGVELRLGKPVRQIVAEAAERGHTLIVMGTRGRGALAEVMVGSVALNVARLAPVPVLFVPSPC
jgi:nucleotide-binding universal stress UspA family protein